MSIEYDFEQRSGYVYFIQEVETGSVKIGFTSGNPRNRLRQLSTGNWRELKIIGVQIGDKQLEQKLHRRFQYLHLRNEWFSYDSSLRSYIESLEYGDSFHNQLMKEMADEDDVDEKT